MYPIRRLPDDLIVSEGLTAKQIKRQDVGWDEIDLQLDKAFGRENENRCPIFIADTGLREHPDIPKAQEAWNFTDDPSVVDLNFHSTWINGKMTAYNNDIGYEGICPEDTPVFILKVLNNQGSGWRMLQAMRKALDFWVNHPKRRSGEWVAAVYNMSYGGGGYSQDEQILFKDMIKENILPFAASGNEGRSAPSFPAKYEGVLSVGAYDPQREKASFTNYGPWTDFVAPGVNVPSTIGKNKYGPYSGTSMACPIKAACAANFISSRPNDKWMHDVPGYQEAVQPYMENLPGTWDGDGVFLPAKGTVRNKYFFW